MGRTGLFLLLVLAVGSNASAQPEDLVARAPALDRLELLVGNWTLEGLPPGETYRETCGWHGDRRHLVCSSRQEWPGRVWEGTSVYTYVYADSTLRLYNFAGRGDPDIMSGEVDGDRLVFSAAAGSTEFPSRRRMTMTPTAEGYDVLGEESMGAGPWVQLVRFSMVRVE